jgi:hypothetical protein
VALSDTASLSDAAGVQALSLGAAQTPGYRVVVSAGRRGGVAQGVMPFAPAGDAPRTQAGAHEAPVSGERTGSF